MSAPSEGSPGARIPIERHELDNGLRVVLSPDPSVPIVGVNLWYGVGSRNERPGRTGFAHLFEHMMFQGSANVPKNGHFEMIQGAGGSLNGSTSFDRTNYYETLPSHHLELALWLESDRMGWMLPAMTQEKLDNQRDVVKNEKRQRYDNQPYGDWSERLQAMLFPDDHPYHHTVIGSMEDLDAATLDDVKDFFRTFYRPDNCVLSVAGDIDPDDALELVDRYFGPIEAGGGVPPVPGRTEVDPVLDRTVRQRVEDDVPLPRVILGFRIPPFTDRRFPVAQVTSSVLATGHASRLYSALVRERKVAKDVLVYAYRLVTGTSMLLVWATGYLGSDPEALEEALVDEIDGVDEVSDADVRRAIALSELSLVRSLERIEDRADLLSTFTTHFDDPLRIHGEVDRIRAVTPDAVRAFAADHLGADHRAVLTYVPTEESS